jgi:hypothetical protein
MRGNSVITLSSARAAWPPVQAIARAAADAVYGCVDWYLYHDPTLAACSGAAEQGSAQGAGLPGQSESLATA